MWGFEAGIKVKLSCKKVFYLSINLLCLTKESLIFFSSQTYLFLTFYKQYLSKYLQFLYAYLNEFKY